jgi:hypothetical protein
MICCAPNFISIVGSICSLIDAPTTNVCLWFHQIDRCVVDYYAQLVLFKWSMDISYTMLTRCLAIIFFVQAKVVIFPVYAI